MKTVLKLDRSFEIAYVSSLIKYLKNPLEVDRETVLQKTFEFVSSYPFGNTTEQLTDILKNLEGNDIETWKKMGKWFEERKIYAYCPDLKDIFVSAALERQMHIFKIEYFVN